MRAGQALGDDERTLSARAFAALRDAILSGTIAPGARLEIQTLASQLQMSPMPIREAVRQLDAIGLAEHVPHRGARVAGLSVDDLREVYAARCLLEAWAVSAAAARFSDVDAGRAAASLSRAVRAQHDNDHAASWKADAEFHFLLYEAAGSAWLLRLIGPLWSTSERYRRLSFSPERDFSERHLEHTSILEACISRDGPLAARRLGTHLARSANRLATALGGAALFGEDDFEPLPLPRAL